MGRKRQQQNEFYFFMVEKKSEVEKRLGRSVSMAELPDLVYKEWKALPPAMKQKYVLLKEGNRQSQGKLDCTGTPLLEIERKQEESKKKAEDMNREIINFVHLYKSGCGLERAPFYVISTSHYVHTDENYCYPAELGLVFFSFEKGIVKDYHVIFKPMVPASYGFTAVEHSEKTHRLLEDNDGVDNMDKVFQELKEFTDEAKNGTPPLYTLEENMKITESIMDSIAGKGHYRIYSLDKLFMHMYSAALPEYPIPQSVAKEMLTQCGLDYHPDLACGWHQKYQKDAGKYCSLSCARRWVFLMCDNINVEKTFEVVPQVGKHLPQEFGIYGVVVNIPNDYLEVRQKTKKTYQPNNSGGPVAKDDSNDGDNSSFSFVYTNKKKPVRQISPVRTESSWTKKGDARGALSSTFSLGSRSTEIDTSCEENFPALGACGSIKGAVKKSSCQLTPFGGPVKGVKLDAMPEVADMPAVADLKLDDKSEFGVWGVSANEFSNPLMTFGRAGRKVKLEDMSEVGRGQKSPNQRSKRGGL